jgi:fructosamine-3-kinase
LIPQKVINWLQENGHGEITSSHSVGGGCINNGICVETTSGETFFLKTNSSAPEDMFAREVEGLEALSIPEGPRIPKPYLSGTTFLLMEDLKPGRRSKDFFMILGRKLAALHEQTNAYFGFTHDNYIGATPQVNEWNADGFVFFGEQRLGFQAQLAYTRGYFTAKEVEKVERISTRLPELVPQQPASLLHGDLWGGNTMPDANGQPSLIDPAVYYGWAEAELAFTSMFGGFTPDFYAAYIEVRPLEIGWRDRFNLYNLYHALNHLNLFGRSYMGQVQAALRRYT